MYSCQCLLFSGTATKHREQQAAIVVEPSGPDSNEIELFRCELHMTST